MHTEFMYAFYITMAVIFLNYGIHYVIQKYESPLHYSLDIFCIYYLFNNQPQYASYYLIYIVLILFFAGLQLPIKQSILLGFLASFLLSAVNLMTTKWSGAQNLLTLSLFNFTYIVSIVAAYQFRNEISFLQKALNVSDVKLKSKEALSQLLIEQIPMGLIATDSRNQILFSNGVLKEKVFLSQQDALDLVLDNQSKANSMKQIYNSNLAEKRFYEIDSAAYFDQELNEKIQINLIKDVSEIVKMQEQMKQKEKLAAVGQLAAGIAHEIRNPLAGISGSIELLSQENKNPDDQKLMKIIIKEIDRLNNLITEFLDYSKPEKIPDQPVDLAFILDEVVQNLKSGILIKSDVNISTQISKSVILGFSDKLKQAFLNIIVNAIHASQGKEGALVRISSESVGDHIIVKINDNGSGMSPEVKNRIFEPFFTTKSKGTGLGMAITHKIFESHRAVVEIDSQVGVGTEFKIIFNKV